MTYYEKRGRRYYPAREEIDLSSLPHGTHMIMVRPGQWSIEYDIKPDRAKLHAIGMQLVKILERALIDECAFRPAKQKLTKRQAAAWAAWDDAVGGHSLVDYKSIAAIARAAAKAVVLGIVPEEKP